MLNNDNHKKMKKLESLIDEAEELYFAGDYEKAEKKLLDCLDVAEELKEKERVSLAEILNMLAGIYRETDRLKEALEINKQAVEEMERRGEYEDWDIAGAINNVARMSLDLGNINDALEHYQRALEIKQSIQKQSKVSEKSELQASIAMTLFGMGRTYDALGDKKKAEEKYSAAFDYISDTNAKNLIAEYGIKFADFLCDNKKNNKAQEVLEEIEDLIERALSEPTGKYSVLEPSTMSFEQMKKDYQKTGRLPLELLKVKIRLGMVDRRLGEEREDLLDELPELSEVYEKINGPDSVEVADKYAQLADEYYRLARESEIREECAKAAKCYKTALDTYKKACEKGDPRIKKTKAKLDKVKKDMA